MTEPRAPIAVADAPEGRAASVRIPDPATESPLGLPSFATLMRWLFLGRTVLAVTTLLQATLFWDEVREAGGRTTLEGLDLAFLSVIVVLLALAVTAYGAFVVFVQKKRPGLPFFQSQAAMDLLLVTALVHFAGAHQSGLAALYVLVMAVYALLMPLRSGLLMALFGSALFLGDAYLTDPGQLAPGLWGQVTVFNFVFLVVGILGQRLRTAAEEQSVLEIELERVRLEADEILRNIRSGVMTVDGQGNLAFLNPTAESILGLSAGALIGRPIMDELERRSPELHDAIVTGIRDGKRVPRAEGVVHRDEGRCFPIGLSTTTFEREAHSVPAVTAIFTDISDLQYLQELHLRTERLEAVASLSASLAHEIRNPLASIRSAVEQLARGSRNDPDEKILGDLILRESDRLSRLLGEFLDFSRVRATVFRPVNLHSIVTDAVRMVREHPDGIGVNIKVIGGPTVLQGDEDLLHRVVWNLVLNAAQAQKGSGKITVSIDQPPSAELPRGSQIDPAVRLRVVDQGPGIDPDLQDRVFEPFVSGRIGGTGLGLAIVQRAVESHRGLVLLDSAPGQGTSFTILLHATLPTEERA